MQSIILAIAAYLFWGSGDIFGTLVTRKIGGIRTAFWFFFFQIVYSVVLFAVFPAGLQNLTLPLVLILTALGTVAAFAMISFYKALDSGSASLVATISSAFPAIVIPLSIIFLKEQVTAKQILAISVILLGVIFSSLDIKELKSGKLNVASGVLFAISAMILFGVYWTFIKIPVQQLGWVWPNLVNFMSLSVVLAYMKVKKAKIDLKDSFKSSKMIILNALFLGSGTLAFYYAVSHGGNISIIAPISSAYPTLYVVLAFLVFKDKITKQQIAGIIVTLAGIVSLAALSA